MWIVKDYNKQIEKCVTNTLITAANKICEDIKSLAPVDTGRYRDSIQVGEVKKNGTIYSIEVFSDLNSGWKGVPLGCLLEWGTGIIGESTNSIDHGYPYRQTPWVYYNERYGRWIFTHGNIARPHFYPGLHLNEDYFKELLRKELTKIDK